MGILASKRDRCGNIIVRTSLSVSQLLLVLTEPKSYLLYKLNFTGCRSLDELRVKAAHGRIHNSR